MHQREMIRKAMNRCRDRALVTNSERTRRIDTLGLMSEDDHYRLRSWWLAWEEYLSRERGKIASRIPSTELRSVSCFMPPYEELTTAAPK